MAINGQAVLENVRRYRTVASLYRQTATFRPHQRASLLEQDLAYLRRLRETISQKLNQLEFEIGQVAYRITVQDKAVVPVTPLSNRRFAYIPVASGCLLVLIVGAFLVRGIRASRRDAAEASG